MRNRIIFSILFIISIVFASIGQEKKVDLAVQFLSNEIISDVNFDKEPFVKYAKEVINEIEEAFIDYSVKQDVLILHTLHKDKAASFEFFSRPVLSEVERLKILKKLTSINSVNTKIVDFSLLYIVKINGGHEDKVTEFSPKFQSPQDKNILKLKKANIKEKKEIIENWAINEALPILAAYESQVDKKFAGVVSIGKILTETNFKTQINTEKLTDNNSDYWRATLEMSPKNQLIPVSKIFMYVSQGLFDKAKMYSEIIHYFSDSKSVPYYLIEELHWRLAIFDEQLNGEIKRGIKLHDKGDYDQAISIYQEINKSYSNSAWLNYELYYSTNAKNVKEKKEQLEDRASWDIAKQVIYNCNPLYSMDVRASSGKEAYLLFQRQSMGSLFKDKDNYGKDFVKYADIAFDLEEYGFAAQLYWIIITTLPKENYKGKNIVAHFLYCLDKLEVYSIKENFKGNGIPLCQKGWQSLNY